MTDLTSLFERPQFSIEQDEKEALLLSALRSLTETHRAKCPSYRRITEVFGDSNGSRLEDLPYVPVSLFKTHHLQSIDDADVFKIMTSSGTTGQAVSRIILDRATADLQTRALTAILSTVLGNRRLPMIIIDNKNVVRDRLHFSARGAGILGMMPFGRKHFYALDDDMQLDVEGLREFMATNANEPVLLFGFTFMVWKYFHQAIQSSDIDVDLSNGTLIHSGGWKKLVEEQVDNAQFKLSLQRSCGLRRIHNFYGMVEQIGSIFLEGDDGFLYPSNFSDVIIRDPTTWEPAPLGQVGVVEVLSVLPHSYPGHVLLTEDLGVVHGIREGADGWSGKQLEIVGRVPRAELRGCSDTHAYEATST